MQPAQKPPGDPPLGRPESLGFPFGSVTIRGRDEARLPAHRQAHGAGLKRAVDQSPHAVDRPPLRLRVGPRDARRLGQARDLHLEGELGRRLLDEAGDRGGGDRVGRGGELDVAFAREQAGGRVEPDPSCAGDIDLAPGMQVGEVGLRPGGAVDGFDVSRRLDQLARAETRGEAELAEGLDRQPGRVAAGAAAVRERLLRASGRRAQAARCRRSRAQAGC